LSRADHGVRYFIVDSDVNFDKYVKEAAVGVDTRNWKITRILLSTNEPNQNEDTVAYQILHLARPLLDTLPKGDER